MPADTSFDLRDAYVLELLALVLEQTDADYGPAELRAAPFRVSQSRAARLIRDSEYLDIIWAMTSRQREETLLPVRIPLMRGLMGARLLVVRREHVGRFAAVDNLRELREFALAQGHDWPDTPVLRANRLTVETSSDGDSLFRMLAHARVDAVPRAITETWAEADSYHRHDLAVEPDILLLYPAPNYFFVAYGQGRSAKAPARGTGTGDCGWQLSGTVRPASFDRPGLAAASDRRHPDHQT